MEPELDGLQAQMFFGEKWDAPATDDAPQTDVPVGERCYQCEREFVENDQGWVRYDFSSGAEMSVHRGCELGTTIGHTLGFCNCTGWEDLYIRGKALIEFLDRCQDWTSLELSAVAIAIRAHAGQADKSGEPYIGHPFRVMDRMSTETLRCIAVLHDVLEDSDLDAPDLLKAGMPVPVVKAVVDLTHTENEPRVYYYERVRRNNDALLVKLADIADNTLPHRLEKLDEETRNRLMRKYATAMELLAE